MLEKASTTYQEILKTGFEKGVSSGFEKGVIKALRKMIRELGSRKYGTPNDEALQKVNSISDAEKLSTIVMSILSTATWDELLAEEYVVNHIGEN